MSLYAWAHKVSASEAVEFAKRFGVGLVLYDTNLAAATEVPSFAYVTTPQAARRAASLPLLGVLVDDERNGSGPSGHYLTPAEYRSHYAAIKAELGTIPAFTMGLQPKGGLLRQALRMRRFDDEYHRQLPPALGRAFNPNSVRLSEVRRVLDMPGPWLLSPAPFRTWWERLWEPVNVRQWLALTGHPNVAAVALWQLRATDKWHGLLDQQGRVTNVGRAVLAGV